MQQRKDHILDTKTTHTRQIKYKRDLNHNFNDNFVTKAKRLYFWTIIWSSKKKKKTSLPQPHARTVKFRYNVVCNRHPIARPWGRAMGCLRHVKKPKKTYLFQPLLPQRPWQCPPWQSPHSEEYLLSWSRPSAETITIILHIQESSLYFSALDCQFLNNDKVS